MKHLLLALPLGLFALPVLGQQLEYSVRGGTTFAGYHGANSTATTSVNLSNNVPNSESSRATNPYGQHMGVGGSLGLRALRIGKPGLLTAFDLSYELLQSRADVNYLNYNSTVQPFSANGSGTVSLFTQAATAFAGVGWRFGSSQKVALDALVGPELAYLVTAQERGSGSNANGSSWSTDLTRTPAHRLDFRLRGELTLWIKRVGVVGSYSYGFTNQMPGTTNTPYPDAGLRVARAGLAYRL